MPCGDSHPEYPDAAERALSVSPTMHLPLPEFRMSPIYIRLHIKTCATLFSSKYCETAFRQGVFACCVVHVRELQRPVVTSVTPKMLDRPSTGSVKRIV